MRTPKAILFDLDGVIIDSEAIHHRAYEIALAPFGVDTIPFEIYAEHWSNRGEGLAYAARAWGVDPARLKLEKEALFLDLLRREGDLRAGAKAAVSSLAARWPTALATGSERAAARHVLERFGLEACFRVVVGREDYQRDKLVPDAFLRAVVLLGVEARECVAIEDSWKGLAAARAARIPCIVVPNDYTRAAPFEGACLRLESMESLTPDVVEEAFGRAFEAAEV